MDEQNQVPATPPQEQAEAVPEWNAPKPVEEELQKYSSGKTLKVFLALATIIIVVAIGIFAYKTLVQKQTPQEQVRQESVVIEEAEEPEVVVEEDKTAEEQLQEIDTIMEEVDSVDSAFEEVSLNDLEL